MRIVLAFEGDRSKFSGKNAMLSELARALTGEELPYATLMYVWCNTRKPGSVIVNPRTDRIRKLVVESGAGRLRQWVDYERDIRADYEKAFGEAARRAGGHWHHDRQRQHPQHHPGLVRAGHGWKRRYPAH